MSYAITALQEALQTKLSASTALQSLLGSPLRLYDHTPPSTAYPFILYGDQSALALDTKDSTGLELSIALITYSRTRGRRELRQIEAAIYAALHNQPLSVSGSTFCQCQFVQSDQILQADGLTYRGQMDFRITLID